MPATEEPKTRTRMQNFTVEFCLPNMRQASIAVLQMTHIRSRIQKEKVTPRGIFAERYADFPDVPGERMQVIPNRRTIVFFDPLENMPELVERANDVIHRGQDIRPERGGWRPPKPQKSVLSDDVLKTLIVELAEYAARGEVEVVEGTMPTAEEIAALPGRKIYDPWNQGRKPRYEDEAEEWMRRIDIQSA